MARYLFASQNKITENRNKKEFRKNLPVARAKPAHPAQQAQRGTGVFFPVPRPEAARWNACSTPPTPPTSPGHLLLPLATSSRLETPRRPPHPFHPPWTSSPSPLREFVDVRKLTAAHHRRNRGH